MVSHKEINDIIQTPLEEMNFPSFQFAALSLTALES